MDPPGGAGMGRLARVLLHVGPFDAHPRPVEKVEGRISQLRAVPMAMAISTAFWLSTGSEPGRPRHTGHTFVLGSSPNMLGQPQNSLVSVLSSQCTSRPTTISHPGFTSPPPRPAPVPAPAEGVAT